MTKKNEYSMNQKTSNWDFAVPERERERERERAGRGMNTWNPSSGYLEDGSSSTSKPLVPV